MYTNIFWGIGIFLVIGYVEGQNSTTTTTTTTSSTTTTTTTTTSPGPANPGGPIIPVQNATTTALPGFSGINPGSPMITTQTNQPGMPPPMCPKREKWFKCGTCEPSCDNPKPVCTLECKPARCQCRRQFLRNNVTGECVRRKHCNCTRPIFDSRQKRQILTTTTVFPGFPGNPGFTGPINPGGPMLPPSQPGVPINPAGNPFFNPGPVIPPRNNPESCQDDEIWQTCNPCEKTCQMPQIICSTQTCSTTTTTTPPTPSPLGLGSFGQPFVQARCVCKPDKVRRNDGKCVDLDECNSTSLLNSLGTQSGQPIQPGGFPEIGNGAGMNNPSQPNMGGNPGQNLPASFSNNGRMKRCDEENGDSDTNSGQNHFDDGDNDGDDTEKTFQRNGNGDSNDLNRFQPYKPVGGNDDLGPRPNQPLGQQPWQNGMPNPIIEIPEKNLNTGNEMGMGNGNIQPK